MFLRHSYLNGRLAARSAAGVQKSSFATSSAKNSKLWGGRFATKTHELTDAYNASVSFDKRLYKEDIKGSIAHANMLQASGIISKEDYKNIKSGLEEIHEEIEKGEFEWLQEREDVHLNIEASLTSKIGDAGGRLHTARSRNDQVCNDMRMFVRTACADTILCLYELRRTLLELAEKEKDVVMPGYTHLQRAQPVLLAHHLQAYEAMFTRDTSRMVQALERANVSPLGSGALAGVSYPVDREMVANELDFESVTTNSIDSVSDRDFVFDFHSAASILMVHISRFSEEIILWASGEFGYLILDDQFSTGSSIMPQKRNPDIAELARGKSARVIGNLIQCVTLLKGQPLAYNKDNQEDKESLFDTVDTVQMTLQVFTAMLPTLKFNSEKMRDASVENFALATDYADYLAKRNVPFREAHAAVGSLVAMCEQNGLELHDLSLEQLKESHPAFDEDAMDINLESCLAARSAVGGTAPDTVNRARQDAIERLESEENNCSKLWTYATS